MAISFSCPSCKTHVQVGDELAGQTGQCPRCERLIVIPSSAQPMPVLLDADGNPVPILTPLKPPREEAKSRWSGRDEEPRRGRRLTPAEKKPAGPSWPWAIGIVVGLAVVVLLFSSFIALCTYRPPEPPSNVLVVHTPRSMGDGVLVGRLVGQRIHFQDGVFQVRSKITPQDALLPPQFNNRHKRYEVELRGNFHYVVELDSQQMGACIRVEDLRFGNFQREDRNPGGNAVVDFIPAFTDTFVIVVSPANPGFGDFTLTVREAHRMKPFNMKPGEW